MTFNKCLHFTKSQTYFSTRIIGEFHAFHVEVELSQAAREERREEAYSLLRLEQTNKGRSV